jgi:hypothetical protein
MLGIVIGLSLGMCGCEKREDAAISKTREPAKVNEESSKTIPQNGNVSSPTESVAHLFDPEERPNNLTVRREGAASFTLEAGNGSLFPFMSFAFYLKTPSPEQIKAGVDYMKARFDALSATKISVDRKTEMTGLESMEFVASYAAQNDDTSLTMSPFHGHGNDSGHYGVTGDFFTIGPDKVVVVILFCSEVDQKPKKHKYDFDGMGLRSDVLQTIKSSKGVIVLSCNRKGELGPSALQMEN